MTATSRFLSSGTVIDCKSNGRESSLKCFRWDGCWSQIWYGYTPGNCKLKTHSISQLRSL